MIIITVISIITITLLTTTTTICTLVHVGRSHFLALLARSQFTRASRCPPIITDANSNNDFSASTTSQQLGAKSVQKPGSATTAGHKVEFREYEGGKKF